MPCRRSLRIMEPTTCAPVYSFRSCLFPCKARPGRGLVRSHHSAGPRFATGPHAVPRRRLPSRQSTGYSLAVHRLFHWLSTVPPVVAFGTTRHWPVLSCGSCSCPCRHTTARPGRRPHTRSPMRPVPPNSARLIILALAACISGYMGSFARRSRRHRLMRTTPRRR
jgi:hypothetical protein